MATSSYLMLGSALLGSAIGCSSSSSTQPDDTTAQQDASVTDGTSAASSPTTGTSPTSNSATTPSSTNGQSSQPDGSSTEPPDTTGSADTTNAERDAGETTDTTDDSTTSDPNTSGPPDGAYVPCSNTPPPALAVEPVLLPPKVDDPIYMLNPPGQPNMFYVAERAGTLKRFDMTQDNPTATTLVTLSGVSTSGEFGFLSFALHPNFDGENEQRAYLVYTPANEFVIKTYLINGDTATEGETLFEFSGDTQSNHNGGLALFGPDGYLYVGIGDGGGGNDRHGENGNGQNLNTTYGKLLRLDVDDPLRAIDGNLTSADVDGETVDGRILHYGLRNPWRFSFDSATDDLYIGDVGQDTKEEVDMIPSDQGPTNFGWAAREGFGECPGCSATLVGLPAVDPIFDYDNPPGNSESRSVTGGFVYRGNAIPGLYGRYLFADYQTSEFTLLTADGEGGACDVVENAITQNEIRQAGVASFAQDAAGELYIISLNDGIFKLVPGR